MNRGGEGNDGDNRKPIHSERTSWPQMRPSTTVCRIRMDLAGSVDVAEIGQREFVKVEGPDGTRKLISEAAFC